MRVRTGKQSPASRTEMQPKLIYLPATRLAFTTGRGSYADAALMAWARLGDWIGASRRDTDDVRCIGFANGLTPQDDGREVLYYAGVVLHDQLTWKLEPEIGVQQLQGGTYESFHIAGSHSNARLLFQNTYRDWLPREGLLPDANRPVLELYREPGPAVAAADGGVDFCIPVIPGAAE